MQSLFVYGRLLTRALVNGVHGISSSSESTATLRTKRLTGTAPPVGGFDAHLSGQAHLLTVWSGFPKDFAHNFVPKPGQFGDDACFIARHANADILGVADGVGGWRSYGVDPSLFSQSLMHTCERLALTGNFDGNAPAGSILTKSYYELLENKEPIIGSSTACVVVLNRSNQTLYTANIGDSGFIVVRKGKVVLRSEEQQHYFNTPFQLSLAPASQHGQVLSDSPESADTASFGVAHGDLILLGTDGLFDNVPDAMIVEELARLPDVSEASMQQAANSLALVARRLAFDESYMSPFAKRARQNGIRAKGGKPDDVTVLLASVNIT